MIKSYYKLTKEGKEYLKKGLPEKNLVELLKKQKEINFQEAQKKVKNFHIAFKWAIDKGWVRKEKDKIILLKVPEELPEQDALKRLDKDEEVREKILEVLLKRNLVKKVIFGKVDELIGKTVTILTPELIKTGLWKKVRFKPSDTKVIGKEIPKRLQIYPAKKHPYNQFLQSVREKLIQLGFKEMIGPTIELEFWNFDALFQPQNHPARDWANTYQIKYPKYGKLPSKEIVDRVKATHENGWKTGSTGWKYKWDIKKASQLMPRAHDTAITPRYLAKDIEVPGKYFSMVRCYRPDVIDAKHGVEFYQMGGIVIGKNLNFRHLLDLLKLFAEEIAGIKEIKFATGYFPFTEPSCEVLGKHKKLGWMELAGAGIFRPELTLPLGIKVPVIAWGFGVDRLSMQALGINDIRELFTRNLEWLRTHAKD